MPIQASYRNISSDLSLHGGDGFGPLTLKSRTTLKQWQAMRLSRPKTSASAPIAEEFELQLEGQPHTPPEVILHSSRQFFIKTKGGFTATPFPDALDFAPGKFTLTCGGSTPSWKENYWLGSPRFNSANINQWIDFTKSRFSIVDAMSLQADAQPETFLTARHFGDWKEITQAIVTPVLDLAFPEHLCFKLPELPSLFELDGKLYVGAGWETKLLSGLTFNSPPVTGYVAGEP